MNLNSKQQGSSTIVIVCLLLVVFLGAGAYFFMKNRAVAPTEMQNSNNTEEKMSPNSEQKTTESQVATEQPKTETTTEKMPEKTFSSGEEQPGGPDIQVVGINYDGTAYTPSKVTIKVGDYVIFYNKSETNFWPASAPHPSHTNYPEFDPKKAIAPGGNFKFQFTKAGSWGFHDHLKPSAWGMVTVTE